MHIPSPHARPSETDSTTPSAATTSPPSKQHSGCTHWIDTQGRRFCLRPLRPDDAALLGRLWNEHLSRPARFNRFHASLGIFSPERLNGLCSVEPEQGGAYLITQLLPGGELALAEGRWAWLHSSDGAHTQRHAWAEFSVSVADHWQGCGLGRRMVQALTAAARQQGARGLRAQVLPGNKAMRALLVQAGYTAHNATDDAANGTCLDTDSDSFARVLAPESTAFSPVSQAAALALARLHRSARRAGHLANQIRAMASLWIESLTTVMMCLQLSRHLHHTLGSPSNQRAGPGLQLDNNPTQAAARP